MSITAPRPASGTTARRSPYVGLEPYAESDAPFFFGREREERIITANLRSSRLTLLYGASGVGKSSVLMAGVVHGLRENVLANASRRARERERSPGADDSLARAELAIAAFATWRDPSVLERLVERIRMSVEEALGGEEISPWDPRTPVIEALHTWTARVRTLLVVLDQFEEYFLYHAEEDGDGTFSTEFPRIVNHPNLRINFLISIREDAWAKLDHFKGRIPRLFSNYLRVKYLDREAARRAIEGPIEAYNRGLEPGDERFSVDQALIDAVLGDVSAGGLSLNPIAESEQNATDSRDPAKQIETPFLQLVMERMWEETRAKGLRELRADTLDELGGAQRIVSGHLDSSLARLGRHERGIAAECFRFLVTSTKTKVAHRAADLAYWAKRSEGEVLPVLERLSSHEQGRILRPLPPPTGEEGQRYEIFHDVLAEAILEWRKRWEQEREKEALASRLGQEERRRLEAERERQRERRARLVRRGAAALLVLSVALAVMTVIALKQRGQARSRALAASAIAQLQTDPELSLLLARKAWARSHTAEAEDALRRSLAASRLRATFRGDHPLGRAGLSGSGELVATRSLNGSVKVWGARTDELVRPRLPRLGRLSVLSFSADGKSLLAAERSRTLIARIGTRKAPTELKGGRGVLAAAFSSDGRYVATAGGDRSAVVWDARTGDRLVTLKHRQAVDTVAFNPKSDRVLATTSWDEHKARVWDWRGRHALVLRRPGEPDTHAGRDPNGDSLASFSPDGKRIVTAIGDRQARVWDARSGAFVSALRAGETIWGVQWSPDSRRVATAEGKTAHVFNALTGHPIATLEGHADWVNTAVFSPQGDLILTTSDDGTAKTWDVPSAKLLTELRGHTGEIKSAAFSSDGRSALTASDDGTVRLWDVATERTLRGHRNWALAAAYSPGGRRLATASADGSARVWNLSSGGSIVAGKLAGGRLTSVSFSPDGRRVVLAGETRNGSGRGVIADAGTGAALGSWRGEEPVGSAEFAPDGRHVIAAAGRVEIRRSSDGKLEATLALPPRADEAATASYSPDGRRIVTAGFDGVARVFDARTRRQLTTFRDHTGTLTGASFSPDGRLVVSTGSDNTARVWTAATGRAVAQLRGHTALVRSAAFSPDGERVVTGGADETTRVWDARSGKLLSVQQRHADSVNDVAFSPNGESIVSAGDDFAVKIYGCETCASVEDLLALAAKRVTRALTADEQRQFLGEG